MNHRFVDEHKRLSHFNKEVAVHCPSCKEKATAVVNYETGQAKLTCKTCSYHKNKDINTEVFGTKTKIITDAAQYFDAQLWYLMPFRTEIVWAFNEAHLNYLESYIAAKLREHHNRTHFTLIEKLPRFYHEAKNRASLLKLIEKMRKK